MDSEQKRDVLCDLLALEKETNVGAIYDVIFIGQEMGILQTGYDFPKWDGLGTARYSPALEKDLEHLKGLGRIVQMGHFGYYHLCESPPVGDYAAKLKQIRRTCNNDYSLIGLLAAYLASRRSEKSEKPSLREKSLNKAATIRLGWPKDITEKIESLRKNLESRAA